MIAYLTGKVFKRLDKQIILMVGGVGYLISVSNDLISSLKEDQDLSLFIHTQVKEDELSLFGFAENPELRFFKQLISVSGIGAKTAMGILDMPLHLTQRAIYEEDINYLSHAPGLGKKTSARLVLELKGKIDMEANIQNINNSLPRSLQDEALQALEGLGYDKPSIIRFINSTKESFESAEDLVRSFLRSD